MLINIAGLVLISLIIWWFWLYKPAEVEVAKDNKKIKVIVDNGVYQPARIKIKAGQQSVIQFIRKDSSPCAGMVVFPDVEVSAELEFDKTTSVELPAMAAGEYPFHCQMQMYKGTLIVE
jgi:plastocyanin domain-containing protein